MKEKDIITKKYISQNDRFADLCNHVLFDGRRVILPEQLKEKDVTELGIPFTEKGLVTVERIRDVLKSCAAKTADGIAYLIIGVENQSDVHYAMVIRNMVQDALSYAAQVEAKVKEHREKKDLKGNEFLSGFAKEDFLVPVITITVYWNSGGWDAPRTLHDMLRVKDKDLLQYVPDYRMNLVVPEEITDFTKFQTELGPVFDFLQRSDDVEKTREFLEEKKEQAFYLSRDAVRVLNACVNAGLQLESEEGGDEDMCRGIQGLVEEGILNTLLALVKDGLISLEEGAKRANKTKEEFEELLNK